MTFGPGLALPVDVLIPLRLVIYNHGSRKLVITSHTVELPQPIVVWLQGAVQYRGHLIAIELSQPSG